MANHTPRHSPPGSDGPADMHGHDLHVEWLKDTNFRYFTVRQGADRVWLPILIETRAGKGKTAARFASYTWVHGDVADAKKWIRIPAMYATPPHLLTESRYCTAMVTFEFFDHLEDDDELKAFIERIELGASYLVPGPSAPVEMGAVSANPPKHVVGGIIDDGCAFALDRFRRANGSSRVAYYWDQDGPSGVPDIGYGRQATDVDIDAAAKAARDESEIYQGLQFLDFGATGFKALGRRVSHGTAAADLAYGLAPESVPSNHRMPVIAVKLPNRVTENPADFELDPWAIDALYYILRRADDIASQDKCGPLPVVVNMSYGITHGPHDGTRILEAAIDQWITLREGGPNPAALTVVLPTGNWFLARVHAKTFIPRTDTPQRLALRAPPDNPASTWTYFYIRRVNPGDVPKLAVQVTDPAGNSTGWVALGKKDGLYTSGGTLIAELLYPVPTSGFRDEIALWIAPTVAADATTDVARSGQWTIGITNTGDPCEVQGWVRRADSPSGHPPFGRQARFHDPDYVIYDIAGRPTEVDNASWIKRLGTISGIATGEQSVVVGGARRETQRDKPHKYLATPYSGAGPVLGARSSFEPDVTALSEDGPTLHGVLACGARSGSTVAINGTSVAAPQVAREALHLLMQKKTRADRDDIRDEDHATPKITEPRGGDGAIVVRPLTPSHKIHR